MALLVPVVVALPVRVPDEAASAADVVVLVNDGNVPRLRHGAHAIEQDVAPGAEAVGRQHDQRNAVSIGALSELVQPESGEGQYFGGEGRVVIRRQERDEAADLKFHSRPPSFQKRITQFIQQRRVRGARHRKQSGPHSQPLVEPGRGTDSTDERSWRGIRRSLRERRKIPKGRIGRKHLNAPVFGSSRGHVRKMLPKWIIVGEVVRHEDQHQQFGLQRSCELVVERELVDLPRAPPAESRGRDVQPRQFPGRHFFEADVKLVGEGNFLRRDKGISDHGDVATLGGARRVDRFTIEKTEAVGARNGPVVEIPGVVYLRIGLQYQSHVGNEMRRDGR